MRWFSKVLVLVAVMAAAGYAFHRVDACRTVFVPAALQATAASAPAVAAAGRGNGGPSLLLYPSPSVEAQLKLGYRTLEIEGDGTLIVVPMPPSSALATTLQLETSGHAALRATLADPRCGAPVEIVAYRPDQSKPVFSSELSNQQHQPRAEIDLAGGRYPGSMLVTTRMADGATNNWWCNVVLAWDSPR